MKSRSEPVRLKSRDMQVCYLLDENEALRAAQCSVTAQNWYVVLGAKPLLQFPTLTTSERARHRQSALKDQENHYRTFGIQGNWLGTPRQSGRQWERSSFDDGCMNTHFNLLELELPMNMSVVPQPSLR